MHKGIHFAIWYEGLNSCEGKLTGLKKAKALKEIGRVFKFAQDVWKWMNLFRKLTPGSINTDLDLSNI